MVCPPTERRLLLFPDEVGCGNLASKARAVAVAGLLMSEMGVIIQIVAGDGLFRDGIDELLRGDGDKA